MKNEKKILTLFIVLLFLFNLNSLFGQYVSDTINETGISTEASDTTEALLYIEKDGICAMEAENAIVSVNGDSTIDREHAMIWYLEKTKPNYAGSGYMTTQNGIAANGAWEDGTELAWDVQIANAGTYYIAIRRIAESGGDDSGHFGVDGVKKNTNDQNFTKQALEFEWVHGVSSLGNLSVGKHTIQIRRRESGLRIDRVVIARSVADLPKKGSLGKGPVESLPGILEPPTITFSVAPHAVSSNVISMVASDTTGRVLKFYFECLTDENHDSGWQESAAYSDSGLLEGERFVYRVKGIDINNYDTEWTDTLSAVTPGTPPTVFFSVAPHAVSDNAISMTASDTTGRVQEFYFECLTDKNHHSGWQISATYVDSALLSGTKYVYRVKGVDINNYVTEWTDTLSTLTTGNPPPSYAVVDGKCVMEAENAIAISNSDSIGFKSPFDGPLEWTKDSLKQGYVGTGYMMTPNGVSLNANWETATELSLAVNIKEWGNYYIAIRGSNNNEPASETAKVGVDGDEVAYSAFWGLTDEFSWVRGPSLGSLKPGRHTIHIRRRQDGLMIDRIMIAQSLDDFPEDGSTEAGPAESEITAINEKEIRINSMPKEYTLNQNYPNPFNPSTTIRFSLPKRSKVRLEVYNVIGERVAELVNGELSGGIHEVTFNAANLSSGMYVYKIYTDGFILVKKMLLLK